jgi:Protein of unknown function (DUF3574)
MGTYGLVGPSRTRIRARCHGIGFGSIFGALLLAAPAEHASQDHVQSTAISTATQMLVPECNGWGGKVVARTELYFGLAQPDGSTVSKEAFQGFVDREVTPRFPAGLTLLRGSGQIRNAKGMTVREGTKLLILLYPYDRDSSRKIESIRAEYSKAFQQESVLRVDSSSCVSF